MHIHKYENWGEPEIVGFLYMPIREKGYELLQSRKCESCGKVKRRKVK